MSVGDLLGFAGVVMTGVLAVFVTRMKLRVDAKSAEANRLDALKEKYYELTDRFDSEVLTRRQAEAWSWNAGLALTRAIDYIQIVSDWIESGAKPPAPEKPDVDALKAALPPAHQK